MSQREPSFEARHLHVPVVSYAPRPLRAIAATELGSLVIIWRLELQKRASVKSSKGSRHFMEECRCCTRRDLLFCKGSKGLIGVLAARVGQPCGGLSLVTVVVLYPKIAVPLWIAGGRVPDSFYAVCDARLAGVKLLCRLISSRTMSRSEAGRD